MRLLLLSLGLLAGCTSLVPSTVAQLDGFSPVTADPADIALALQLPEGVGLTPAGATLFLGAERDDTGEETGLTIRLAQRSDAELGEVFEIAPDDRAAFRAEQARIAAWQAEAPEAVQGTLSLGVAPCRFGAGPARSARASADIRFAQGAPFRPLLREAPLSRIADQGDVSEWPDCVTDAT
ncbi:MAG: hypothetical protein AAGC86_05460 [Pseudomonadota bacterium]